MRPPSPTPPHRGVLLATLIGHAAFGLLSMTLCLPSMQEWAVLLGTSQAQVQLSFSVFVIAFGGFQLLWGPLSDQWGRRPLLALGLALSALGATLAGLADGIGMLLLGRFVQGIGSAAGMVVGRAAAQDLFSGPERTRAMAMLGVAMGLCPPAATLIGGQLHVWWGWRSVFGFALVLAAALAWLTWRVVPAGHLRVPDSHAHTEGAADAARTAWWRQILRSFKQLLRDGRFRAYAAMIGCAVGAFYAYLAGTPIVLAQYGVGPARVGLYLMIPPLCYIVGNLLTGKLSRRFSAHALIRAGQVCTVCGVGLSMLLAYAGWQHPLAFVLPLTLMGLGHGFLMPASLAGAVGLYPALAGAAAALAGVAQQLTGAMGGYMVGWSARPDALSVGSVMLGFTLLSWLAMRGTKLPR